MLLTASIRTRQIAVGNLGLGLVGSHFHSREIDLVIPLELYYSKTLPDNWPKAATWHASKRLPLEDVQADYICVSVIKLPVSTFELTFVATILGRSMTYDVVHERFPSNGYHVAQYLSSGRAPCRVHLPEADA